MENKNFEPFDEMIYQEFEKITESEKMEEETDEKLETQDANVSENDLKEEKECEVASAELLHAISEQCSQILKIIKKDEVHDTQVNTLQRRCLAYEEDIVYTKIKGTIEALIKVREDIKRGRGSVIRRADKEADYLEDIEFDLDVLNQVADDCNIVSIEDTEEDAIDVKDIEDCIASKAEVEGELININAQKEKTESYSLELAKLSMICDKLLSRYDILLDTVIAAQKRIQALCIINDNKIVKCICDKIKELCDNVKVKDAKELSFDEYVDKLGCMIDGIGTLLQSYGVMIDHADGDVFDALTQKAQKIIPTDDPALSGHIAERVTDRYSYGGKVIYQERVFLYKYKSN